ncbi:hypothetical protein IHE45_05G088500 [Dioscorea alata]|uniref:Uncharacterized protein n=1 Tax=Dioscorea alata TaxID=55571 RepID=A0ACB7W2X2_DIOAL|nr:hypothetical protein IHE45_05G088500 [Dioscorea alata]
MDTITSFFSNLFSHVSSINTQYLRPLLSFNSRNNTITTTDEEQASQETATNTDHSIIAMEVTQPAASTAPSSSSDGQEDQLKKTRKLALTIALSIAAISAGLVIHPLVPKSLHFLLTPYKFLLNGSLFIGVGLAIYSIKNNIGASSTRSNSGVQIVWVLRMSMRLGIITIFLAVVFRGLMIQS